MSLLSIAVTNEPTGFVRVLRALRVIRLFGRFHSLRKIISAITLAIVPVLNVFVILFLLISIGAQRARGFPTIDSGGIDAHISCLHR